MERRRLRLGSLGAWTTMLTLALMIGACDKCDNDGASGEDAGRDAETDAPAGDCATDNGGCDPRVTCDASSGEVVCGACPTGFTGTGDTACVDVDECATDNGGCEETCTNNDGSFTCACAGGFAPPSCEQCVAGTQDNDTNRTCTPDCATSGLGTCSNHGTCDDSTGTAVCECDGGYEGATCGMCPNGDQDFDGDGVCSPTCAGSGLGNCSGHGACDDSTGTAVCECEGGYEGTTCTACAAGTQDMDNNGVCAPTCAASLGNCSNHGTCSDTTGTAICTCTGGYEGESCGMCPGGGQDNDGDGDCTATCENSGLGDCSSHGECRDTSGTAVCVCEGGYEGTNCTTCGAGTQDNDTDGDCTDTCAESPIGACDGHGTCSDATGTATCTCADDRIGESCEACPADTQDEDDNGTCTVTCEASSLGTCSDHGACAIVMGTATCECEGDRIGTTCESCPAGEQDNDDDAMCDPTCATSPIGACDGHGTCSDTSGVAVCTCANNREGADCSACPAGMQDEDDDGVCTADCSTADLDDCSNHGACDASTGTALCVCDGDRIGDTCEACPVDTQDADDNGTCTVTCAASTLGNCSGHGACDDSSGTAVCECSGDREGTTCEACPAGEQDSDDDGTCEATCATAGLEGCSGHGACGYTGGLAVCTCTGGYTGAACDSCPAGQQDADDDGICAPDCTTAPIAGCSGHGTCSVVSGAAVCSCTGGYTGASCDACPAGTQDADNNGTCELDCTTSPIAGCSGHGTCSVVTGSAVCSCTGGYTGASCDACPAGQQDNDNNGVCAPTCATAALDCGVTAGMCSDASGTATCACNAGFYGSRCQIDSSQYSLVYDWDPHLTQNIDTLAQANAAYTTNNSGSLPPFSRVAYLMVLDGRHVWAEFNAHTTDASAIGIPHTTWFDGTVVTDLQIASNAPGVTEGTQLTGQLEMWNTDYGTGNNNGIGSGTIYDVDDTPNNPPSNAGYGSFQVHSGGQTLLAWNRWGGAATSRDLGIGTSLATSDRDWTFYQNSGSYTSRRIAVYVKRPRSCREQKTFAPASVNGVYMIDPDGGGPIPTMNMYCDMTTTGGGWTLIGKFAAGNYTALTDQAYTNLIANPIAHVNVGLLQNGAVPNAGEIAFYDRPTTNALFNIAGGRTVRVDMSGNTQDAGANGTYYQQRVSPPAGWDFWRAIRDGRMWNRDGTVSGDNVNYFGTDFVLTRNVLNYDAVTNTVTHSGDGTFGHWSTGTLTLNGGGTMQVSRHFGLLCDGHNNGWQWIGTADPTEVGNRWKNDTGNQRSLIWLR